MKPNIEQIKRTTDIKVVHDEYTGKPLGLGPQGEERGAQNLQDQGRLADRAQGACTEPAGSRDQVGQLQ